MTSPTLEEIREELIKRANLLLEREGETFSYGQCELMITGWTPYPIVIDHYDGHTSIHYDAPRSMMLVSSKSYIQSYIELDQSPNRELVELVLNALRRYMLLDDLASA